MSDLYVDANKRAQVIALLMLVMVFIVGFSIEPLVLENPIDESNMEEKILMVLGSCLITALFCFIAAHHFWRLGYGSLKTKTYPPKAAVVLFRTRVRTDKDAIFVGLLYVVLAFMFSVKFVSVSVIGYLIWTFTYAL